MRLILFALRNLAAWQGRNLGALSGTMIAVASFVALIGLSRGVELALLQALDSHDTDVVMIETGALDLVSSIVPTSLVKEIAAVPGVAAATPDLTRMTTLDDGRSLAVSARPTDSFLWQSLTLIDGAFPAEGQVRAAVLGEGAASRLGLRPGDRLTLFHDSFTIVGIVSAPDVMGRSLAYITLSDAQDLTFREGQATSIIIRLSAQDPEPVIAALQARFPAYSFETTATLAGNTTFARLARVLALAISSVALLSAVLVIYNTMAAAVSTRRGEIAILTAIGWTARRIVAALLIESAVITTVAGLAGIAIGILVARVVSRMPEVVGFIEPVFGPELLAEAFALSIAVGLLGALVPALRAVSKPPAEVLRGR